MSQKKVQLLNPLSGNINVAGVITASSFVGGLTGNVTGNVTGNTSGTAGGLTGTPNITVGSVTAASGAFSGNVSVGGTLTYQDVSHIDAVGIITAQQGIQVLANGLDVTGVGTFKSNVSIADSIIHTGDTDTAIRFPSADTFTVETGGSEALRVDSSQRLLRGTTSAETFRTNITPSLQIEGTSANTGSASLFVNSDDSSGPFFVMGKSRATGANGDTVVQNNDGCGAIQWVAADGTDRASRVALIAAHIDGTPGSNDTPGRLIFSTTADGASTSTERVRITSSGNVGVGENSPQQRLHVSSTASTYIQVQNTGDSVNAYYGVDTASAWAGSSTNHPFKLHTNNTERLRITSTGGVHFNNGELIERVNVTAGKLSDNTNIDLEDGMAHLFTTTETTTATPNIRVNSSTTLNSVMATGDAISVTIITTAAAAAYSAQLTIDGVAVTEKWNGGSAPSAGGSSGNDVYSYTIIKTGDAAYTVLANVANFA